MTALHLRSQPVPRDGLTRTLALPDPQPLTPAGCAVLAGSQRQKRRIASWPVFASWPSSFFFLDFTLVFFPSGLRRGSSPGVTRSLSLRLRRDLGRRCVGDICHPTAPCLAADRRSEPGPRRILVECGLGVRAQVTGGRRTWSKRPPARARSRAFVLAQSLTSPLSSPVPALPGDHRSSQETHLRRLALGAQRGE